MSHSAKAARGRLGGLPSSGCVANWSSAPGERDGVLGGLWIVASSVSPPVMSCVREQSARGVGRSQFAKDA